MKIYAFAGDRTVGKKHVAQEFIEVNCLTKYAHIRFNDVLNIRSIAIGQEATSYAVAQQFFYGDDIWIKYLEAYIEVHSKRGIDTFVISDVSTKLQIDWLLSKGATIYYVDAPLRSTGRNELTNIKFNKVIYNDFDSYRCVREFKLSTLRQKILVILCILFVIFCWILWANFLFNL